MMAPLGSAVGAWPIRAWSCGAAHFVEAVDGAGRVDEGGAGIQRDRHAERLREFFLGGAELERGLDMAGDAAVAARRHRNRKRDQGLPTLKSPPDSSASPAPNLPGRTAVSCLTSTLLPIVPNPILVCPSKPRRPRRALRPA